MKDIYFTSDTHYGHKNICRGVSEWTDKSKCRDFDTLEEMNEIIVKNINEVVKPNDILYHLGDWSFGGKQNIFNFRRRLHCKTIHLIYGNHDIHIEKNAAEANNLATAQEMFASTQQYLVKKINGQGMFLCHYSMRTWDKAHHGTWNLYGHSHGTLEDYGINTYPYQIDCVRKNFKAMDVGIDTNIDFMPYHFEEIREIMKNRIPLKVDHHNEHTN